MSICTFVTSLILLKLLKTWKWDWKQNLHVTFSIVTSYMNHYLTASTISVYCAQKNAKSKNARFNYIRIIVHQCKFNICLSISRGKQLVSSESAERLVINTWGSVQSQPGTKNALFPQRFFVGLWPQTLSRAVLTPVYNNWVTLTCYFTVCK